MLLPLQICGLLITLKCHSLVRAIAFDEVSSLQVWLTVDSLARPAKDKSGGLIARHIELNWLNAPLDPDGQDYLALYLDVELDDEEQSVPVAVHRPTLTSGRVATQYYLPYVDFYNETTRDHEAESEQQQQQQQQQQQRQQRQREQQREYNQQESTIDYQLEGVNREPSFSFGNSPASEHNTRWHQYNTYGPPPSSRPSSTFEARTASEEGAEQSAPGRLTEECLGYCVAYHDGRGRVLARNCLRTSPTWMEESRLGSRSLPSLMLPGTHNSGTYPKHLDRTVLQMINKYQMNQEESVFNQLVYGIRYLDLRVGYSAKVKGRSHEELWVYHDIFRTENSLQEVFEQVRRFLEMTQHELVVLDFHRFTVGFQNENSKTQLERHGKLLDLLFATLGHWIVPSYLGQHAPINEYTEKGKRLVVCYANRGQLLTLTGGGGGGGVDSPSHHSLLFGPLGSSPQGKLQQQQVARDIDAEKQDDMNHATAIVVSSLAREEPAHEDQAPDRRVGTRIYNRLKALKLISHSFSKRSVPSSPSPSPSAVELRPQLAQEQRAVKVSKGRGNVYKKQQQSDRSMKVLSGSHTPLVADSMNSKLSLLFNSVRHIWPNTDTETGLRQFIDESTCRRYFGELRSLMAEMTPGVFGAISDQYDGIRKMSHSINRMVTDQIRSKFLHCVNMVASDYFLGNDLIRLSIYANRQRLHHQRNVDLSSIGAGQCKSFRRIGHLLDKARIGSSVSTSSLSASSQTTSQTISNTQSNSAHPDKESDLFSFFRRIFNLR